MEALFDIQKIVIEQFEKIDFYERRVFAHIKLDNRINGIVGARGIGKTAFLIKTAIAHGAKTGQALYFSADNIFFLEHNLLSVVDRLYKETDVRLVCIDEIQKQAHWRQLLKNIFDTYPDFKIIFSGSSAIDLVASKYDLSRRVSLYALHGFSFREYLDFYHDIKVPVVSFNDILKNHITLSQTLALPQVLKYIKMYWQEGYYPFFKTLSQLPEKRKAIENTTLKSIYEDISVFHSVKSSSLLVIERLFKFVLTALPGTINANKLAHSLHKDFDSVSLYLSYLEKAGLIRFLYPNKVGHAYIRNPVKMLPDNSNLMYAFDLPRFEDATLGKVRETFIVNQLQNAGFDVYYSDIGDFSVNGCYIEVGGRNKSGAQLQKKPNGYVAADGILTGSGPVVPLYLFGLLY